MKVYLGHRIVAQINRLREGFAFKTAPRFAPVRTMVLQRHHASLAFGTKFLPQPLLRKAENSNLSSVSQILRAAELILKVGAITCC